MMCKKVCQSVKCLTGRQPSSLTIVEDGAEDEREVKWCYDTPGALQPDQVGGEEAAAEGGVS